MSVFRIPECWPLYKGSHSTEVFVKRASTVLCALTADTNMVVVYLCLMLTVYLFFMCLFGVHSYCVASAISAFLRATVCLLMVVFLFV